MRRTWWVGLFVAFLSLTALNCKEEHHPLSPDADTAVGPEWFEDVTKRVGLDFVHDPGPLDGKYFMPQIVGSGAALFDFDSDGRLDIYLLHNGGPS
ncbi:MAG TPA: hypothetical protein VN688_11320, partial [Gemmataceae bacterium]|nr:hypothetical protein [Gemmataceae bacterium]